MAAPKRTGGPKTAQGKAVSARNSLQHGLRSRTAMPGAEQQAMDALVAQLAAYYRPRSPLETLQIQRIARCAAKLNTLYAVEKAKTALALMGSQATDDQAMLQFAHYPAAARNLALELMQPSQTNPKFGLTDTMLNQLCQEMDDFAGVLENESHLAAGFPKLARFLRSTEIEGFDGPYSMDHRLWAVASLLETHMRVVGSGVQGEAITKEDLFDQVISRIALADQLKESIRQAARPRNDAIPYQSLVHDDFNVFKRLRQCRQQAQEIATQFPQVKALLAASTTMPGEDSDRLMRYQTTLEKQLSRYIGELLQLKNAILPNEP